MALEFVESAFCALYKLRAEACRDDVGIKEVVAPRYPYSWRAESGQVVRVVSYLEGPSFAFLEPADVRSLAEAVQAAVDAWKKANPAP